MNGGAIIILLNLTVITCLLTMGRGPKRSHRGKRVQKKQTTRMEGRKFKSKVKNAANARAARLAQLAPEAATDAPLATSTATLAT